MIQVKQTILHDPDNGIHGNCLSAFLASLLHLDINSIPIFSNPETWLVELNAWLKDFGLAYMVLTNLETYARDCGISGLWHEIYGSTVRSADILHACVGKDGKLEFDPHPDGTGLVEPLGFGVFIILEPWKAIRREQQS